MKNRYTIVGVLVVSILTGAGAVLSTPQDDVRALDTPVSSALAPGQFCTDCGEPMGVAASYLPGTRQSLINHVERMLYRHWLRQRRNQGGLTYQNGNRWSGGGQGSPISLTWSVVPDGLFIPNAIGEGGGNSNFQQTMTNIFGSFESGMERVRLIFDRWEELSGIDYTEVSDDGAGWGSSGPHNGGSNRGDIRISMKNFANNFFGVLAYNFFPDHGDMVMNSDHAGDFASTFSNYRLLRNTMAHENGHGQGISHVCPANSTKLMEPFIFTNRDGPQHDDIRATQRHYGDPFENNNSSGFPHEFGQVNNGTLLETNLSIDDNTDLDWFSFTVDPAKQTTISVTPIGLVYQSGAQTQQCNSGTTINSLTMHNLKLQLRDTDGSTVLVDINDGGDGDAEVIEDFVLPSGGTFFIRVAGDSTNDVQIYDFRLTIDDAPVAEFALLAGFEITKGTLVSGVLEDLQDSDDVRMKVASETGFLISEANVNEIRVLALSPFGTVSDLDVFLEASVDNPGGKGTFRMRNWNNNTIFTFNEYNVQTTESVKSFTSFGNPNRFIDQNNGNLIEAWVKHAIVATFTAAGFNSLHDQIGFEVTP